VSDVLFLDGAMRGRDATEAEQVYGWLQEAHGALADAEHGEALDHYLSRMVAAGRLVYYDPGARPVTERLEHYRAVRAAEAAGAVVLGFEDEAEPDENRRALAEHLLADPQARAARLAEIQAHATPARPRA